MGSIVREENILFLLAYLYLCSDYPGGRSRIELYIYLCLSPCWQASTERLKKKHGRQNPVTIIPSPV